MEAAAAQRAAEATAEADAEVADALDSEPGETVEATAAADLEAVEPAGDDESAAEVPTDEAEEPAEG
jgi:hypothetical protein